MGATIPAFEDILYYIDCLYKVNRLGNALDIVNDLDFKANPAQEAIGKIERLSKLVQGGKVNIRDVLMACAIKDNISDGARIALVNTMALIDRECEQVRFTEFKAAFKQTFSTTPSSDTIFGKNFSGNYDYNNKERRSRSRSKDRNAGRSRDFQQQNKSPHRPRRDSTMEVLDINPLTVPTLQDLGTTTGQVPHSVASTLVVPVKKTVCWIPGPSEAVWGRIPSQKWGVI